MRRRTTQSAASAPPVRRPKHALVNQISSGRQDEQKLLHDNVLHRVREQQEDAQHVEHEPRGPRRVPVLLVVNLLQSFQREPWVHGERERVAVATGPPRLVDQRLELGLARDEEVERRLVERRLVGVRPHALRASITALVVLKGVLLEPFIQQRRKEDLVEQNHQRHDQKVHEHELEEEVEQKWPALRLPERRRVDEQHVDGPRQAQHGDTRGERHDFRRGRLRRVPLTGEIQIALQRPLVNEALGPWEGVHPQLRGEPDARDLAPVVRQMLELARPLLRLRGSTPGAPCMPSTRSDQ